MKKLETILILFWTYTSFQTESRQQRQNTTQSFSLTSERKMSETTPSNTIILKCLRGRTKRQVEEKLNFFGTISLCKIISSLDLALIVFESQQSAINAKEKLLDETIDFAQPSDVEKILRGQLEVPVLEHNYLISPPPSPPEDWVPTHEELSHITTVDLDPHLDSQQQNTVLLDPTLVTPQIVVEGKEILPQIIRTSSEKFKSNEKQCSKK